MSEKNAPEGGPGAVCLEFADEGEARAWDSYVAGCLAACDDPEAAEANADAMLAARRKRSARIQAEAERWNRQLAKMAESGR